MKRVYILDSSAILSGKPISLDGKIIAPESIEKEVLKEDPKLFQIFAGMNIHFENPSRKSLMKVEKIAEEIGEAERLSKVDKEIVAIALDYANNSEVWVITDDYSIQNILSFLGINFKSISQRGILERFVWRYQCEGCKKIFKKFYSSCPICGSSVRLVVRKKYRVK